MGAKNKTFIKKKLEKLDQPGKEFIILQLKLKEVKKLLGLLKTQIIFSIIYLF